jgi:hypothetical protein
MQFKSIFAVVAAGLLSMVAANVDVDLTTTSTSTLTQTITITQCNPTLTNCPAKSTSVSSVVSSLIPSYPLSNSTSSVGPTAYYNSTTIRPSITSSAPIAASTSASRTSSATSSIPTSGAVGLYVQSSLLLSVLGAGVALLA